MTTIVNTPSNGNGETNSGMNSILVIGLLIVFFLLIVYFGLPLLRRATPVPQVTVPDKIDVNVNAPSTE